MVKTHLAASRPRMESDDVVLAALPATLSGDVATAAIRLMARAEAMGLIDFEAGESLNQTALGETIQAIESIGVGRQLVSEHDVRHNLRGALEYLSEALEQSPHPDTEWRSMSTLLGSTLLSELTGVSETSIRRYSAGERDTPDDAASRVHFLAMISADVLGAYNSFGLRRWFQRPRTKLDGQSPQAVLGDKWDVDGPGARRVSELARSLVSMGAS